MGRYYALHDGEPRDSRAGDRGTVPAALRGRRAAGRRRPAPAVALADKLETLVGLFGIGAVADRRQGSVRAAPARARRAAHPRREGTCGSISSSCRRARFDAVRRGDRRDRRVDRALVEFIRDAAAPATAASSATRRTRSTPCCHEPDVIADVPTRLEAVRAFAALPEAASLAAADKRVAQHPRRSRSEAQRPRARSGAADGSRRDRVCTRARRRRPRVPTPPSATATSRARCSRSPSLNEPVDRFFDDVMVNADDPASARNRLGTAERAASADEPRRRPVEARA